MPVDNHVEVLSRLALQFIEVRGGPYYWTIFKASVNFD